MTAGSAPIWWRNAPALRFLAFFLVAWIGARVAVPFFDERKMPLALAAPPQELVQAGAPLSLAEVVEKAGPWPVAEQVSEPVRGAVLSPIERYRPEALVAALPLQEETPLPFASSLPDMQAEAVEPAVVAVARRDGWSGGEALGFGEVPKPASASGRAGWSLSAWALVREKTPAAAQRRVFAGELAGSQMGARLAYGLGGDGAVQLYGRASMALYQPEQSEAALGMSYRPVAELPVDVAVERRQKIGGDGRNAMAAMLVGGVSGQALPLGFQLDAYGQAGVVGLRSRDAFVDGALVVDRGVREGRSDRALRLGLMAAGAAQPNLSRLDVGPRVTLPLPQLGKGMRVALDYRNRILGNAEPKNGPAITIGADF